MIGFIKDFQEIQRLYHDSYKSPPASLMKNPSELAKFQEKMEKFKKEATEKEALLKENIKKSSPEETQQKLSAVDEILRNIQQIENPSKKDKAPALEIPQALLDFREQLEKYGAKLKIAHKPFDVEAEYQKVVDAYRELLAYAQLGFLFEKNGEAKEHALKLAIIFGDARPALAYLKTAASIHDACLFNLPPVGECDFATWRLQTNKENMMSDPSFKAMLPFAADIEVLFTENAKRKQKPDLQAISALKKEITKNNSRWRVLNRKHGSLTDKEEIEYQDLGKKRLAQNAQLLELSAGVPLKDADILLLQAYNEKSVMSSSPAYVYFREHGLTKEDHKKFLALNRDKAGKNIPDLLIDGKEIGYPGFYLKKVDVRNEREAARVACGGKLTNCCQSLSGEQGEPCVIHGLTSMEGGFYIVCQGDATNPKFEDDLVGLSWAWRSNQGGLVLDSVEVKREQSENDKNRIKEFMRYMGFKLVTGAYGIPEVTCGAGSGISSEVGLGQAKSQMPIDYDAYRDSAFQLMIAHHQKPYLLYGRTHSKEIQQEVEKAVMAYTSLLIQKQAPFKENPEITVMISYALTQNLPQILHLLETEAGTRAAEMQMLIDDCLAYVEKLNKKEISFELLAQGADINIKNTEGDNALLVALKTNRNKEASLLLERGADINLTDGHNQSPLMLAIQKNNQDMIAKLLEKNPELNTQNTQGETALMLAIQHGLEETALQLLAKGANVNLRNNNQENALMLAIQSGNKKLITEVLKKTKNLNKTNKDFFSPLMMATQKGDEETVSALIAQGADVTIEKKATGENALSLAAKHGHLKVVKMLLESGIDLTIYGDKTLLFASKHKEIVNLVLSKIIGNDLANKGGPLLMRFTHLRVPEVISQLLARGVDVHYQDADGNIPLTILASSPLANKELATLLLTNGAQINYQNKQGDTALILAARAGNKDMVALLLEKGADITLSNLEGNNALMEAKTAEIVVLLLAKGFNINTRNKNDDTPLMLAAQRNNRSVVDKLLGKGADASLVNKQGKNAEALASQPIVRDLLSKHKGGPKVAPAGKVLFSKMPPLPAKMPPLPPKVESVRVEEVGLSDSATTKKKPSAGS